MRAGERIVGSAIVAIALWGIGCREIPAPEGGVAALSPVQLPSPGLVVGDTMRDSAGAIAPLQVIAYGLNGLPLTPQPPSSFVVLDTGAHMDGAFLVGDSAGPTVRVVGEVGALQTQFTSVPVTQSPDTLVPADSLVFHKTYSLISGDTAIASPDLSVLVQHLGTPVSGVRAVVVYYTIDSAPTGHGQGPTARVTNGVVQSNRDTTEATGRASRTVRLRLAALNTPAVDTVAVSATASYRGRVLGAVQFLVIYTKQ